MTTSKPLGVVLLALLLFTFGRVAHAAVELNSFSGEWQNNQARLAWETGSEGDHAGFHVWRSTQNLTVDSTGRIPTAQATRLTTTTIQNPDGLCNAIGNHDYTYVDTTVQASSAYYYYLESISCSGSGSTFTGDLSSTGGLRVASSSAPSPTVVNTAVNSPTRTATVAPSNTPEPSSTPRPGETAVPASNTPVPSATQASAATATRQPTTAAATATAQPGAATATRPPAPTTPPQQAATATVAAPDGGTTPLPTSAPLPSASTVADTQGGAEGTNELPATPTLAALAGNLQLSPEAAAPGGAMSQGGAATPTVSSIFSQAPGDEGLAAGASNQSDGMDRVIQGVIGLILLGVVALIGFIGWSYAKKR